MVASCSGFVLALHAQLDPALLGAIIKLATRLGLGLGLRLRLGLGLG